MAKKKTPAEITAEYTAKHEALEAEAAAIESLEGKTQKYYELQVKMVETLKEGAKLTGEYTASAKDFEGAVRDATDVLKGFTEVQAAAKKAGSEFNSVLQNTIKTFTGITDGSETLIGSFLKQKKALGALEEGTEEYDKAQKELKESLEGTFDSLNVGLSILSKVKQSSVALAMANDQATASFNAATGAGGRYDTQIIALERSNRRLGISADEIGQSFVSLIDGLSGFGLMSEENQSLIVDQAAELNKLGVAAASFTGVIETATRSLGMSTAASQEMIDSTTVLAQELGISLGSAIDNLNQALPKLVAHGKNAGAIFAELQEQAVKTGISVNELIDIADQFKTFDDAATAAGNLNAVLGTQLFSTMELLEARARGPEEVIDLITNNLQASIGDWETLDFFQKEAVASAAGMTVEQLSQMMNQQNMTEEQKNQAKSQKELLASARSLAQELKILFAEFAVSLSGVISAIKFVVGGLSTMLQWASDFGGALGQVGALFVLYFITKAAMAIIKQTAMNVVLGSQIGIIGGITAAWTAATAAAAAYRMAAGASAMGGGMIPGKMGAGPAPMMGKGGMPLQLGARASTAGRFAGAGKWLGRAGGVAGVGMGAYNIAKSENKGKSLFKGLLGAGAGFLVGGPMGAAMGFGIGSGFQKGTDDYPGGPLLNVAGENGAELTVPPPGSAIINNETMTKAVQQGGEGSGAVVAAINNLSAKVDTLAASLAARGDVVLEVNKREFGRVINEHFGVPGTSPLTSVTPGVGKI